MSGPLLFTDPGELQLFIGLIYDSTGLFANIQTPSVVEPGTVGVIDKQTFAFDATGTLDKTQIQSNAGHGGSPDGFFCTPGVTIDGLPYVLLYRSLILPTHSTLFADQLAIHVSIFSRVSRLQGWGSLLFSCCIIHAINPSNDPPFFKPTSTSWW